MLSHHRGSFAALLRVVKINVNTDWEALMDCLLGLIENNRSHILSRSYIQELYLWLHVFEVHSVNVLTIPPTSFSRRVIEDGKPKGLNQWNNVPSIT